MGLRKVLKGFHPRPGQSTLPKHKVHTALISRIFSLAATFIFDSPSDFSRINFARMAKFCLSRLSGGLSSHPKMQSNSSSETSSTSFRHEFNFRLHCFLLARRASQHSQFPSARRLNCTLHPPSDYRAGLLNPKLRARDLFGPHCPIVIARNSIKSRLYIQHVHHFSIFRHRLASKRTEQFEA